MSMEDQETIQQQDTDTIQGDNDSKTVNVGSGVRVEGRIEGAETSDISGTLSGTIKSSNINITNTGVFNGDMSGQDISISGNVEGEINSDEHLIVNQSANIKGTIEYSSLQVSYGAKIQGTVRHKGTVHSYTPNATPIDQEIDQEDETENFNNSQEEEV